MQRWGPWTLVGFTVVLWLSRLRNVLRDDDLTNGGRTVRIGVVILFVGLALAAGRDLRAQRDPWLIVLIVWTVGYWVVRGGAILIGDWSFGFKAVHTVLMVASLGLAGWAAWARFAARSALRSG